MVKTYVVGGAVRDALLGLPSQDHDHVVVGATPEKMVELGFRPVGKDFPVFLHPKTHEEYALARTERKTAAGYKGFVFHTDPSVTLEEDLIRRDLTMNAIARDEDGQLIDPFHGQADIKNRLFRHVSPAFLEDPVRILRVARFAARFSIDPIQFSVAPETMTLMRNMVDAGEVDALVPERVWQEIAQGLQEVKPSRMFDVLRECGALKKLMPELDTLWGVPQPPKHHPEIDTGVHIMLVVDYAAQQGYSLAIRFAALMHDLGKGTTFPEQWPSHHGHEQRGVELIEALCSRLRVPNDCRDLAVMAARDHGNVARAFELRANTILTLFERSDAFRKPDRFNDFLKACECDCFGRGPSEDGAPRTYPQSAYLSEILSAVLKINAGEIAQSYLGQPSKIAEAIRLARLKIITQYQKVN